MFTGIYGVFSAISMEKGCKNYRETQYSSKGKIVYVVGNPCNISDTYYIKLLILCEYLDGMIKQKEDEENA